MFEITARSLHPQWKGEMNSCKAYGFKKIWNRETKVRNKVLKASSSEFNFSKGTDPISTTLATTLFRTYSG